MQQPQIVAQQAQQFEIPKEYVARLPDFLSGSGKNGRFSGQGKARGGVAFPNAALNKESTKENNAGIQFSAYGNVLLPAPEEFCKAKFFP